MKTLKDIPRGYNRVEGVVSPTELRMYEMAVFNAFKKDLRQEAIKWIKKFMNDYNIFELPTNIGIDKKTGLFSYVITKYELHQRPGWSLIAYIMYVNNITEEELK